MGNGRRKENQVTVAFTGGGTGGHIYPGLAVAALLKQKQECGVFWIGSENPLDKSIVEEAGIPFFSVPSGKFRRNFSLRNFIDVFNIIRGYAAAKKILKQEKPALLFSKGGFVSVPPCAAASSLGIPVFTHESDFSPGLATRINARYAAKSGGRIIAAYPETKERFSERIKEKVVVLGNPVRSVFKTANPEEGRAFLGINSYDKILLVLGGSQGARELNELVYGSLDELEKNYIVVHQTGTVWKDAAESIAGEKKLRYKPFPYIKEELPHVLAAADLVLARSGAGTVWECATLGKPMVLLPLAGSGTRGDQIENALFFEKAGAAIVLHPNKRRGSDLKEVLQLLTEEKLKSMALLSLQIGNADGAGSIVRLLTESLQMHSLIKENT